MIFYILTVNVFCFLKFNCCMGIIVGHNSSNKFRVYVRTYLRIGDVIK